MNENENSLNTPENENSEPKTEACPPPASVAPQRSSYPESLPHVPPSETTLEHPDARGQQALAAFGTAIGSVHIFKVYYFLKIGHTTQPPVVYLFSRKVARSFDVVF